MTKADKEYARKRVNSLLSEAKEQLREKYTTPGTSLSAEEKLDLVLAGEVEIADVSDSAYRNWQLRLKIEGEWPGEEDEEFDEEAFEQDMQPLREKAQSIKDEITLGQNTEALESIKTLASMINQATT